MKEAYPDVFSTDEFKMRHLRSYIHSKHSAAQSAYFKTVNKRGGMPEVPVETQTRQTQISAPFGRGENGEGDAAMTDESAGPPRASRRLARWL